MRNQILIGDALATLRTLPDESVHCCVTSPPYWGLRDYGEPGQLGLESTPEEHVERIVEVFREVRRVLRSDGTIFVNLGDSYAGSWGNQGRKETRGEQRPINGPMMQQVHDGRYRDKGSNTGAVPPGLKHKDLVGIPWRVARALQEPYYTGAIRSERDRIWLAAMVDAEGCIFIHKRKAGQNNGAGYVRKNDSFGSGLEVSNTSRAIVERCMEIAGKGSICTQEAGKFGRKQTLHRWNLRSNECRGLLRELYPYLVAKHHEARLAIGCPSSGEDAAAAHESLKALHNGIAPSIDFDEPDSMYEPGWYLRCDVIWAKKNCMPESVTDRPTKAHEYLFLLSKSARYFYDADAVREEMAPKSASRYAYTFGGPKSEQLTAEEAKGPGTRTHPIGDRTPGGGRNRRSVWSIATQPYAGAHFAVMPPALVAPCIRAGCPQDGVVLDPFMGAGTVGLVARENGRDYIGIELNPEYAAMAEHRIVNRGRKVEDVEALPGQRGLF